jgi:hypothetical protein
MHLWERTSMSLENKIFRQPADVVHLLHQIIYKKPYQYLFNLNRKYTQGKLTLLPYFSVNKVIRSRVLIPLFLLRFKKINKVFSY